MLAIVFPGQGSQRPGMGRDLVENRPAAKVVFERVTAATGIDMQALCWDSDEETLRQTQNAQIALFTCSLAAWEALRWEVPDIKPQAMAGHSVGEYAALAAANVLSIEDGARLVRRRGELMAKSGVQRPGTMAAVLGMERDELEKVASQVTNGIVVVANDNCPGQIVISGDINAVQAACALATENGAKRVMPLNVSGAFHSPLMDETAREFAVALAEINFETPDVPVYSNVTTEPGKGWADLLEAQLMKPVRWTESIRNMRRDGVTTFVECGGGEVLVNLIRRIDRETKGLKVADIATLNETVQELSQ
jgi:[acyl-carrier-protein] S-malonyltransferase